MKLLVYTILKNSLNNLKSYLSNNQLKNKVGKEMKLWFKTHILIS